VGPDSQAPNPEGTRIFYIVLQMAISNITGMTARSGHCPCLLIQLQGRSRVRPVLAAVTEARGRLGTPPTLHSQKLSLWLTWPQADVRNWLIWMATCSMDSPSTASCVG
jgi:hypothetical protein